jgi:hypothetical protein
MKILPLVLLGALTSACYLDGFEPSVESAGAAIPQLSQYDTFTFGWTGEPPFGYEPSARSLVVDRLLRELVGSALRQKGYVENDDHPSFLVRFGSGILRVTSHPTEDADPLGVVPEEVLSYEGVQIVVYDMGLKTAVWRGSAHALIDPTKEVDMSLLHREVEGAFGTFPARSITAAYPFRG